MRAGWIGTIRDFLIGDREAWVKSLENHVQSSLGETASQANRAAWLNSYRVLKDQLGQIATRRPDVQDWGIAFEYELPRERGRRIDVGILAGESVVLLEFKDFVDTLQAHVDQVAAYARDLSSYQAASHNRSVIPVLVKTLSDAEPVACGQVWITGATGLGRCIERIGVVGKPWTSIAAWIDSPYAPLPSLVRAARMIFKHEPLPRIKQAENAGVADAVAAVAAIIEEARSKSERHIVFVTEVPGAGKTLTQGLPFPSKPASSTCIRRPLMLLTKRERMPVGRTVGLSGTSAVFVADDRSGATVDWVFVSIATGARTARPWISRRRVSAPDPGDATGLSVGSRNVHLFVGQ